MKTHAEHELLQAIFNEMQLAHVDKNAVRGTYNHAQNLDDRRKMMQDWADMVDKWKE